MSLSLDGQKIREAIKKLMKKSGYQYLNLAQALQVSLPTVKRIMTRDDISLERLLSICDWLEISLSELIELSESKAAGAVSFTPEQEKLFAAQPLALLYFHLLLTGWSSQQLAKILPLSKSEFTKLQLSLEKIGLAEVSSGDKIRLTSRGPFRMNANGPMEQRYFKNLTETIFARVKNKVPGYSMGVGAKDAELLRPFECVLDIESYFNLAKELNALVDKYRSLSRTQIKLLAKNKLKNVSGLLVMDTYYAWPEICLQAAGQSPSAIAKIRTELNLD